MKKSKFLKSSKDMLSRSFNPSKCKTSLRLAGSRLKLLRNKKEVQVKQMKREIAQLLESGQDQTARIRVEHVIREEKMMAAYDLIEIYCELIVARLPIIESQKNCPIDLKEAIASVVFASPRCGDVPELLDVRKHFKEKYGKDFTTAAIELRPECGVSRMLVEKLSAIAPDGQTKIKILSAIAEEHNVKWEPKSFKEDSVPPSDLLTGPSSFGKESKLHVHSSPLSFSQLDHRTSLGTERPLGDERAKLFQGDSNTILLDRQRWNMEFKDATSAAQAAAESAELASMAARAAAELSSRGRIVRQHSTESHKSNVHVLKDSGSRTDTNRSFSKYTRLQDEKMDEMKPNNLRSANGWPEKSENVREESIGKKTSMKSSHSHSHSNSNSSTSITTDVNIFSNSEDQKFEYDAGEGHFLGFGKEGIHGEASHASFQESAAVVFDKSDSDSDIHGFDMGPTYDEQERELHLPSSGQKSREHLSINTDSWSPKSSTSRIVESSSSLFLTRKNSSSVFSENSRSIDRSKLDDPVPVTFDESDEPTFESDVDMNMSRHTGISGDLLSKQLSLSSDDELKCEEMDRGRNQGKKFDADRPVKVSLAKSSADQPDLEPKKSQMELNFEKLTGGFRHKGYNHPPYLKNRFDAPLSSNKEIEETTAPGAVENPRISTTFEHKKGVRTPDLLSESDSESSDEEESLQKSSYHKQDLYTKPSLAASNSFFGSDNSDLDEDLPKESLIRTSHLRSGISRRTKVSKTQLNQPTTGKVTSKPAKSSFWILPENSNSGEKANSVTIQEFKITRKSSAIEEFSRPRPKIEASVSSENLKRATLYKTFSNKDDKNQKASHVHPKLPDYDTLVQSLGKNSS